MDEKNYFSSINIRTFLLGTFVIVTIYCLSNVVKVDQPSEFTKITNEKEVYVEEKEIDGAEKEIDAEEKEIDGEEKDIDAEEKELKIEETNILDDCFHVYLGVGSNIGVQVRILFEQDKYPNAAINPIFNLKFGHINERHNLEKNEGKVICAVGFEPNGKHTEYIKSVENAYRKCGWRAHFMTETTFWSYHILF